MLKCNPKSFISLLSLVAVLASSNPVSPAADPEIAPTVPVDLAPLLEPIRDTHGLPALGAAVLRGDGLVALGVAGVRSVGNDAAVTIDDLFHLGSCTKAMTATLAAVLVSEEKIRWTTTIAEAFPELQETIHSAYHDVTLEQLLVHQSGLPEDRQPGPLMWKLRALDGSMQAQRLELVELALSQEPATEPGTTMAYSNAGYAVAGAMLEGATQMSWEDLMREHLFAPLDMRDSGFGPPGKVGVFSQPRGHRHVGEKYFPVEPVPFSDNPAVLGPGATVHATLADWARFAALHLRAGRSEPKLIEPEFFTTLHQPGEGSDYAMGFITDSRPWAKGTVLFHDGSNGIWYAVIWLAPEIDMAFLAVSNAGPQQAAGPANEAITALIDEYVSMTRSR